jgi:hypothetical protein
MMLHQIAAKVKTNASSPTGQLAKQQTACLMSEVPMLSLA